MTRAKCPIAVFDSGVGGISVMRELMRQLPQEQFVYFGDCANAPYGSRPTEEIRRLSIHAYDLLSQAQPKATVIACNTATSAAADLLRQAHPEDIIVGIEPALRPAARRFPGGHIVVMATEATLREQKFAHLMEKVGRDCRITPLPCPELVEFVERGEIDGPALLDYLTCQLAPWQKPDAVVLGCTHFPFVRKAIARLLGPEVAILDGGEGTARQTRRLLQQRGLLHQGTGSVRLHSSGSPESLRLMERLLQLAY